VKGPPIDGAVVVITGASSGIGRELARLIAPRARVLVVVARRVELLVALAAELAGAVVDIKPCDLSDLSAADRLIAEVERDHGGVDVLINNAGMGDLGLFTTAPWSRIEAMLRVNVLALTFLTHRVLPRMVAKRRGGILNISSGFGLTWMPLAAAYVGSKHHVTAFTEALRTELAGTGVVVTQSCPGPVRTGFLKVAGNPLSRKPPALLEISAARCAAVSLAAFERRDALVVPGVMAELLIASGRLTPSWVLRILYGLVMRVLRPRLAQRSG